MSLRLIVTRHAKSSWDDPLMADFDRPLNKRGQRSAPAIGAWLKDQGWVPDEILSSPAQRTRETVAGLGFDAPVIWIDALYHGGPGTMLGALHRATGTTVALVGHNPGIAEFAEMIVAQPPDHARFFDYPTCATLLVAFDGDTWRQVDWHRGRAEGFVIPRERV